MAEKRKIHLSFEEIPEDERDDCAIYVRLYEMDDRGSNIAAIAESNEEFITSLAGKLRIEVGEEKTINTKYASTIATLGSGDFMQYDDFIEDLINFNNGEVDYHSLIFQGAGAYTTIKELREILN